MRKTLLSALLAAALSPLMILAASTHEGHTSADPAGQSQTPSYNWFDPSTWGVAGKTFSQPGMTMPFNPAHPASWVKIIDPRTHVDMHMAFTNPANYAQFMQPQFYMQFMNPNTWLAWMNPANYAVFMNPATYLWWMSPTAYVHGMDPNNYMQMLNPASYAAFMNPMTYFQWMNPNAYAIPGGSNADAATSFDWNDWFKMFDPNTYAQQPPGAGDPTDPNKPDPKSTE